MGKHIYNFIKAICFIVIAALLFVGMNNILLPKYTYDDTWPTTSTLRGFYTLEDNSLDFLVLGSSQAATAFNPAIISDETGLTGYNLAIEQETPFTSYFWLVEALKTQSPDYLIFDCGMLFPYEDGGLFNAEDNVMRKAFENMKWSENKFEALSIMNVDEDLSIESFIFPNLMYHDRWKELTTNDFKMTEISSYTEMDGYTPLEDVLGDEVAYYSMYGYPTDEYMDMVPLMEEYFDKIVELCYDNNIKLILVKTPTVSWDYSRHNTMTRYAAENSLEFIDFNDTPVYSDSGFVFSEDMNDLAHVNVGGAEKISEFICGELE